MMAMDERAERRRSPLLGNPYQQRRKTLLSSDDSTLANKISGPPSEDVPGKRRKGLLSTPEIVMKHGIMPNPQLNASSAGANAFKTRKRPALLPESPAQMPSQTTSRLSNSNFQCMQSFPSPRQRNPAFISSTNPSKPTASNEVPLNPRRVLLSLSSEEKPATISNVDATSGSLVCGAAQHGSKATSHDTIVKASQIMKQSSKTSLLDYLSSDLTTANTSNGGETKLEKATMTEGRSAKSMAMELNTETDLPWLLHQRELIDKRIAELQDREQANAEKKDLVVYINGYYCQVCRKLIRGNHDDKMAHCQEESHLLAEASANDPETVLKYFEERYDGMAFDDDDGDSGANAEPWTRQPEHKHSIDFPKIKNGAGDDGSSCVGGTGESDEDDEQDSGCERFDRTRISRQ